MLLNEAKRIGELLSTLGNESISTILNIGSSTFEFRENIQPWINEFIFNVLNEQGVSVMHSDIKSGNGVDLVGDLSDPDFQNKLKNYNFNLIICANLLEHVINKEEVCELLERIVDINGYILLTVPHKYPYHPDPIDTKFRPSPAELSSLFRKTEIVNAEVLVCGNYLDVLLNDYKKAIKVLIRILMPLYKPKSWYRQLEMLTWLRKNYEVTILLLRKIGN